MRIISGNYKGKKLFTPKDKLTRPLKDAVKESIFNILEHSNLNFLKSLSKIHIPYLNIFFNSFM